MFINVQNTSNPEKDFYIKLLLTVDPELYPYYPPSIRYLAPNAKRSFIYNMSNLELLKLENWNPVINMDWLITNLSNNIKDYVQEYIVDAHDEEITELDKELIEFSSLIGEKLYKDMCGKHNEKLSETIVNQQILRVQFYRQIFKFAGLFS